MFYVLGCSSKPRRWLDLDNYVSRGYKKLGIKWFRGTPFPVELPNPLYFQLEPKEDGNPDVAEYLPPFLEGFSCPLFRDDLLEILYACGVDNFDVYSAEILDPDSGKVYKNYKAVNIIGAVAAADMEKSEYVLSDGIPLIDVPFDKLVLRKDEIQDLLIFRLAENLTTILVHESIRNVLLDKGYITGEYMDAIQFYELDKFGFL
ncbi:conserved hypothetical protein [Teredinibacter turnerae T7901]|uniref:Immunity MXAN-0049 protein domain-containing protein n=1 Tax=Teredinibacter turnerae (strain ATCC 39867 / T7901) TaxID=377629 RepID=C5BJW6_TERTT|nr:DUF1629 domain-containing protein [Teredinibacter turnerae]ACR10753.1 conserved hypothetical protein [Teredinibacter turnerae T7901]